MNVTVSHAAVIASSSTVVVHVVVTVTTLIPAAPHPRTNISDIKVHAATALLSADERRMNNSNLKEEESENNTHRGDQADHSLWLLPVLKKQSIIAAKLASGAPHVAESAACRRFHDFPPLWAHIMIFVIFVLDKFFV